LGWRYGCSSIIAAPLIVLVLAAMLFSVELVLLIALALLLVAARLAGVIPWTIGVVDLQVGTQRYEKTRSLVRAIRLVRDINGGRRGGSAVVDLGSGERGRRLLGAGPASPTAVLRPALRADRG
jgi:hypothetical protein